MCFLAFVSMSSFFCFSFFIADVPVLVEALFVLLQLDWPGLFLLSSPYGLKLCMEFELYANMR